ncbi:MAG: phosphatidate cytidylyltransferase [Proteobacteria bacterium]|nr:phosphatidate cytidylyltransferase [Pseudomonadota bacterium]MDA0952643.1 phosphatidate cytidylyltransferase [Pseudomonadota bacterium]
MTDVMAQSPRPDQGAELAKRLVSGIVLAVLAVGTDLLGGWFFKGFVLLLALGVAWEWFEMTRSAGRWAACAAVVAVWFALAWHGSIVLALYCVVMGAVGTAMFALVRRGGEGGGWSAGGSLYATLPLAAMLWIHVGVGGPLVILWLFAVVWFSDIGAFSVGRTIGGPKLAPAISPSKTWSGALGGLASSALFGATLAPFLLDSSMGGGALMATLVGIAAQIGDLFESWVKRRWKTKDSGRLIPGHGGIMDRLDSLATAAPVFALIVMVSLATRGN